LSVVVGLLTAAHVIVGVLTSRAYFAGPLGGQEPLTAAFLLVSVLMVIGVVGTVGSVLVRHWGLYMLCFYFAAQLVSVRTAAVVLELNSGPHLWIYIKLSGVTLGVNAVAFAGIGAIWVAIQWRKNRSALNPS
jgi:hypothetical protein